MNHLYSLQGLNSLAITIDEAGQYVFEGKLQLPHMFANTTESQVVVTITTGAGPCYTGTAGADGFECTCIRAVGDIVTISLTSTLPEDMALNAVRGVVNVYKEF